MVAIPCDLVAGRRQLLYLECAFDVDSPTSAERHALIAVPVDPESDPVMVYERPIGVEDEGYQLASQNWGRHAQSP